MKESGKVIDFGAVNLKSLILTTDAAHYTKVKSQAQGNIGVLFEPDVVNETTTVIFVPIYLVGILEDE